MLCILHYYKFAEYAERAQLNSKHRLGCSPRVKIEIEKQV